MIYSSYAQNSAQHPQQSTHVGVSLHRVATNRYLQQGSKLPFKPMCRECEADGWVRNMPSLSSTAPCHLFVLKRMHCTSATLILLVTETAEDNQRRKNDVLRMPCYVTFDHVRILYTWEPVYLRSVTVTCYNYCLDDK